jgi:predicted chitinase
MQLIHKENYRKAGEALNLYLVGNPDQVARPEVGFKVAVWYWNRRDLNSLADQNTLNAFKQITTKINGGQNGAKERE